VASVTVLKGRAALLKYGPDASYGVVIIRTKRHTAQTD
jgi:outer membrane receptor protein involved in Fe transport